MADVCINVIRSMDEIESEPRFNIDNFLWNCVTKPCAYAQLGYIEGRGLGVKFTVMEANPKREYKNFLDPVCKDSAVELFLSMPQYPLEKDESFSPTIESLYMNFEVNSNGAMHAKYKRGRKNHTPLSEDMFNTMECSANIENDYWTVSFVVPQKLLLEQYGRTKIGAGDAIWLNLYKISESPEIEHYAAYGKIENETPNFHMPQFFVKAMLK